jgi:MoaA/NifB/PqqE/SkfB family radical SAM enzyme
VNLETEDIIDSIAAARLSIEVTTRCNSSCVHCFARAGEVGSAEIPVELVKEIIDEGYSAAYRHLHITGGEPLLYGDIFKTLDYAIDLGYETILLNTNGILLTRSICKKLANYSELTVTVSLEGTEALHDRLRGKGSCQKVIKGLENGIEADLDVIVFTTACKSLLPELPDFADILVSRFPGIKYLTLIRLVKAAVDAFPLQGEFLDPGDFVDLVNTISLINLYGLRVHLLNDPLINVVSRMLGMPWIPESQALCHGGNLMVKADLRVSLSHTGSGSYGRYESGLIDKILISDRYKQATAPDRLVCPACKYAELCRNNGLIRPTKWHMHRQTDSPYCKAVLDLVAP